MLEVRVKLVEGMLLFPNDVQRLAFMIVLGLVLVASIALDSSEKVVVLAR